MINPRGFFNTPAMPTTNDAVMPTQRGA